MNRRSAMLKLLAAGAGFVSRSQAVAPEKIEDDNSFVLRSEVRLVLLDVAVRDRRGAFVEGLTESDFQVFEDGRRQPITVFDASDRPVTVGLLVDESRSMTPKRDVILAAAEIFVRQSNPKDEVFVLNFNDRVLPGLPAGTPFSDNLATLRAALHRGIPEGRTALNDAVMEGLKHLSLGTRDRKALIVISDGGDNASKHKRAEVLDSVTKSLATIYAIGLYDEEDADRDPGIMRRFAELTGGEAYFPQNLEEMEPVCRGIAQEIRSRYTIGYIPRDGPRAVRRVQVRASSPGHRGKLTVHTRSSYRYDTNEPKKG